MEEEFNLISKTIGRTILDQDPMTLIFVASHHARLHLFSEYGVIQEIFNFELNLARNFDKIVIIGLMLSLL